MGGAQATVSWSTDGLFSVMFPTGPGEAGRGKKIGINVLVYMATMSVGPWSLMRWTTMSVGPWSPMGWTTHPISDHGPTDMVAMYTNTLIPIIYIHIRKHGNYAVI